MDSGVLKEIAVAAVTSEKATGCPAELVAAQCALESGWLKFAPGNNCFGIKAYDGCPDRQLLKTTEWFNDKEAAHFLSMGDGRTATLKHPEVPARHDGRREYSVQDWFAAFPTLGDCFARRAAMFNKGRYALFAEKFLVDRNLDALVHGIAPIYATDPNYATTVLQIAHQGNVQAALAAARGEVA